MLLTSLPETCLLCILSRRWDMSYFGTDVSRRWNINYLGTGISKRWDISYLGTGISSRWDICHLGIGVSERSKRRREQKEMCPADIAKYQQFPSSSNSPITHIPRCIQKIKFSLHSSTVSFPARRPQFMKLDICFDRATKCLLPEGQKGRIQMYYFSGMPSRLV